jgi:benzylsuccinate CoA-transferase BbsE subunit
MGEHQDSLLSPYRILELAGEKCFLCGKILGDMGADVIKIEPPGGDRARSIGPFYQDRPDPERSLYWFAYNANKRGITLNLESEEGKELFKELVKTSDALIEGFPPGDLEGLGLGYEDLCRVKPNIILTSISPFGQDGPYRDYKGSDMVCWAMGGMMYICGDPDRPPVRISLPQAYLHAGAEGAVATTFAFYHRNLNNQGQRIDVSAQACVTWTMMQAPEIWSLNKMNVKRAGIYRDRPAIKSKDRQIWECKDGHVHFLLLGGIAGASYMPQVTRWLDQEGLATAWLREVDWVKGYDDYLLKPEHYKEIEGPLSEFFRRYTKKELYQKAREERVQLYPVYTSQDILEDEQLKSQDFWQQVDHPEIGAVIVYPGPALKVSNAPLTLRRRAPLIGEHNEEIYLGELGMTREKLARLKHRDII